MKDSIWWTRRSRIETERRLLSNLFHAELLLIWYALCSVGISIYLLESRDSVPQYLLVTFSVMTLAASLYVNTQSYKERAMKIKACYEALGKLYHSYSDSSGKKYRKKYLECLDMCENHNSEDYYNSIIYEHFSITNLSCLFGCNKKKESRKPTCSNKTTPVLTKKPNWFVYLIFVFNLLKRQLARIILYLMPIFIVFFSMSFKGW